ncbi:MAG: tetratricopeptide repeat protein [candidate division Zixibacteria bacterium]|nr:tetratricopeptide repeat protein [candidate division Zixibacteria bacterium]
MFALATLVILSACLSAKAVDSDATGAGENEYRAYEHYVNADLMELNGDFRGAIEEYKKALKIDPNLHEARYNLAWMYFRMKDLDASLEEAALLPKENAKYAKFVGGLYADLRMPDKAIEYYRIAVKNDSSDFNSLYRLAQLFQLEQKSDTAIMLMEKVSQIAPENSQTYFQLGEYFLRLDRYDLAVENLSKAIRMDSTNTQAYAALGLAYERLKDTRSALDTYSQLQNLQVNNELLCHKIIGMYYELQMLDSAVYQAELSVRLFPHSADFKKTLGNLYLIQRKLAEAGRIFTTLSQEDPQDPDIFIYLGQIDWLQKNLAGAESNFLNATRLTDTLLTAWLNLAAVYLEQDKLEEAEAAYQRCLTMATDSSGIYFEMGLRYTRANKWDQAEHNFRFLLQKNPTDEKVQLAIGNLYQQKGDFELAQKYFLEILAHDPDHATALNNLSYLWSERGINLEKSLQYVQKALEIEPENPAFLDSYGWVLYKLGELESAEENLRKALRLSQSDPEVYHHLGDLYQKKGEPGLARENWEKALELDPGNQILKEKLKN